jgi:AAA+ ATPase superfamily predicted ATPase
LGYNGFINWRKQMNRKIKEAIKVIATELAKEELETALDIHKHEEVVDETRTLKVWLREVLADHNQAEDFIVGEDLETIQQAIGEQLVKQFQKMARDAIARGW